MSLDIYLEATRVVYVYGANYTHNVAPMWRLAGCYDALYMSDGERAHNRTAELRAAVAAMEADPAKYQALDAPNGWGTYETALEFLKATLAAFEANPDATIRVSK